MTVLPLPAKFKPDARFAQFLNRLGDIALPGAQMQRTRRPRLRLQVELEDCLMAGAAAKALRAVVDWGRFAALFAYDDKARTFFRSASEHPL